MAKSDEGEKKKLIRVKCSEKNEDNYKYTNMNFTFVSSPENERMQCSKLMSCRENVNKAASKSMAAGNTEGKEQVDFEKLRLLVVKSIDEGYEDFKMRLFSGKALLNRYEEEAGWNPSTITTVKHKCHKDAWLLTGPKEWMSQPQLLSIATIFIRIMSVHGPLEVDTFEQAEGCLEKLYLDYMESKANIKEGENFNYYPDIEHYLRHLADIKTMVTHSEEIFTNITLEKAWKDKGHDGNFSVQSGLISFLGGSTLKYNDSVASAQKRFIKLKKKLTERSKNNGE